MNLWYILKRVGLADEPDVGEFTVLGPDGNSVEYEITAKVSPNTYILETSEGQKCYISIEEPTPGLFEEEADNGGDSGESQ